MRSRWTCSSGVSYIEEGKNETREGRTSSGARKSPSPVKSYTMEKPLSGPPYFSGSVKAFSRLANRKEN